MKKNGKWALQAELEKAVQRANPSVAVVAQKTRPRDDGKHQSILLVPASPMFVSQRIFTWQS